jgi:hypothetical protein
MDSLHTVAAGALREVFRQGPMSQGKLDVAWRVAVGEALSRVSSVRLLSDGSIEIHPVDRRWHRELERSSGLILARLKALLGTESVKRLSIK